MTGATSDDRFALTPISRESAYRHIQYSPLGWMFLLTAGLILAALMLSQAAVLPLNQDWGLVLVIILGVLGLITYAGLCVSMHSMLVADERDGLLVAFGQWRFPRIHIPFSDIAAADVGRTTIWEGWGIHLSNRGWVWNIWGRDCVVIHRRSGRTFLIGTEEPERLAAFLKSRISDSK
jgi:hypothetical protein